MKPLVRLPRAVSRDREKGVVMRDNFVTGLTGLYLREGRRAILQPARFGIPAGG
jgi:hypothetical protein